MLDRDSAADRRMAETPALPRYLPWILLYPLRGHALGLLLLLPGFLWWGLQNLFGVFLLGLLAPWVLRYAEAIIEASAAGQATPPRFTADMMTFSVRSLRPLVAVLVLGVALYLVQDRGTAVQVATLAAGAFLLPGFMLVLTAENSLLAALNPLQLLPAIWRVGGVYLLVCLVLAVAASALLFTVSRAAQFTGVFVSIYLWLMAFHLLGYVAYHRAGQLGLALKAPPPTDESRRFEEQDARLAVVLRNLDAALSQPGLEAAARALVADPGGPADVRLFHEELFEQVQRRRKVELIHLQGQRLIAQLLREKRVDRALDVAETCFDAHADFATDPPAHAVVLAEAALKAQRDGLFERLARDPARRYRKDPAVVSLQFLCARYWCERKRDDARARQILRPLLAETKHPQHRQMAAYAKAIGIQA
jgi:hypothetical protein